MEEISPIITAVADEVFETRGNKVKYSIGCGLDTPRACLRAQAIASEVLFSLLLSLYLTS